MTTFYGTLRTNDRASPPVKNKVTVLGGRVRYVEATYTVVAGALPIVGDTIEWFTLPKGARLIHTTKLYWSAGAASQTLNLGDSGSTARYMAATAVTSAGSATADAHFANGGVYEEPTGSTVTSTVAGATLTAAAVYTLHAEYVLD